MLPAHYTDRAGALPPRWWSVMMEANDVCLPTSSPGFVNAARRRCRRRRRGHLCSLFESNCWGYKTQLNGPQRLLYDTARGTKHWLRLTCKPSSLARTLAPFIYVPRMPLTREITLCVCVRVFVSVCARVGAWQCKVRTRAVLAALKVCMPYFCQLRISSCCLRGGTGKKKYFASRSPTPSALHAAVSSPKKKKKRKATLRWSRRTSCVGG